MGQDQNSIQIRRAAAEDSGAIAALLHAAFVEYEPLYTPAGFAATTPAGDQLARRLAEGPLWLALLGTSVVGTVGVIARSEAVYVRGMAVLPAARGRRMGEALLSQVERYAVAQGAAQLTLSTTPFLTRAIRLYERLGFRRSDDGPQDLYGTPLFTMVKLLAAREAPEETSEET
ncbi:MAG: GNAT family N-acetyltransferase [Ktedonobacterales bacterium]|jgi:putative acetyltransferase